MMECPVSSLMPIKDLISVIEHATMPIYMVCDLCNRNFSKDKPPCGREKNGYCALFRLQAAKDMIEIKNKQNEQAT